MGRQRNIPLCANQGKIILALAPQFHYSTHMSNTTAHDIEFTSVKIPFATLAEAKSAQQDVHGCKDVAYGRAIILTGVQGYGTMYVLAMQLRKPVVQCLALPAYIKRMAEA